MTGSSDLPSDAAPPRAAAAWCRSAALSVIGALAALASPALAASPGPAGQSATHGAAAAPAPGRAPDAATSPRSGPQDADAGSRSVAARARMNECGHQWNNMKRAGTASGTWKEFSRNCLAQK